MKKIYLNGRNNHLYCLIDNKDFFKLSRYKWYLNRKGYVQRNKDYINKLPDTLPTLMHNMILNIKNGFVTDHINENKLDNQKVNLRYITNTENIRRRGISKRSTTGFKGVYIYKKTGQYVSSIRVNKKLINLGYFKDKEKAVLKYNEAAKKYHREFAYQNII